MHIFQCGVRGCGVTHFDTEFVDAEERKRRLAAVKSALMGWDAASKSPVTSISINKMTVCCNFHASPHFVAMLEYALKLCHVDSCMRFLAYGLVGWLSMCCVGQVTVKEGVDDTSYHAVRGVLPMVTGTYKWRCVQPGTQCIDV